MSTSKIAELEALHRSLRDKRQADRVKAVIALSNSGRGRLPKPPFQRADTGRDSLDKSAWTRINVRDGEKGPLVLEIVKRCVLARTERSGCDTGEELLVITRSLDENGKMRYDYHPSNAHPDTPLEELARVVKAEHRVEDCIKRAKSEAGLSDYEVRTWTGWYHHQTLSLIATGFLLKETRRGKKYTPALTVPQVRILLDLLLRRECDCRSPDWLMHFVKRRNERRELARFHHYKRHNLLAPLHVREQR